MATTRMLVIARDPVVLAMIVFQDFILSSPDSHIPFHLMAERQTGKFYVMSRLRVDAPDHELSEEFMYSIVSYLDCLLFIVLEQWYVFLLFLHLITIAVESSQSVHRKKFHV